MIASGKARIRLFGAMADAAGKREDFVELPLGATLHSLLLMLADAYGEAFRGELMDGFDPNALRDDVMLTVNGKIIRHERVSDTSLSRDDEIGLFPVFVAGG